MSESDETITAAQGICMDIASKIAKKMLEIEPDLDPDEVLVFAHHFLIAKYALKMIQSEVVREEMNKLVRVGTSGPTNEPPTTKEL